MSGREFEFAENVQYTTSAIVAETINSIVRRYGLSESDLRARNSHLASVDPNAQLSAVRVQLPVPIDAVRFRWEIRRIDQRTLGAQCRAFNADPFRADGPVLDPASVWNHPLNADFRRTQLEHRARQASPDEQDMRNNPSSPPARGAVASGILTLEQQASIDNDPASAELAFGTDVRIPGVFHLVVSVAVSPTTEQGSSTTRAELMPEQIEQLIYGHVVPILARTRELEALNQRREVLTLQQINALQVAKALLAVVHACRQVATSPVMEMWNNVTELKTDIEKGIQEYDPAALGFGAQSHGESADALWALLHDAEQVRLLSEVDPATLLLTNPAANETTSVFALWDAAHSTAWSALRNVPLVVSDIAVRAGRAIEAGLGALCSAHGRRQQMETSSPLAALLSLSATLTEIHVGALPSVDTVAAVAGGAAPAIALRAATSPWRTEKTALAVLSESAWGTLASFSGELANRTPDEARVSLGDSVSRLRARLLTLAGRPDDRSDMRALADMIIGDLRQHSVSPQTVNTVSGIIGVIGFLATASNPPAQSAAPADAQQNALRSYYAGLIGGGLGLVQSFTSAMQSVVLHRFRYYVRPGSGVALSAAEAETALKEIGFLRINAQFMRGLGFLAGVAAVFQGVFKLKSDAEAHRGWAFYSEDAGIIAAGAVGAAGSAADILAATGLVEAAWLAPLAAFAPWLVGGIVIVTLAIVLLREEPKPTRIGTLLSAVIRQLQIDVQNVPGIDGQKIQTALTSMLSLAQDPDADFPHLRLRPLSHPRIPQVIAELCLAGLPPEMIDPLYEDRPDRSRASVRATES